MMKRYFLFLLLLPMLVFGFACTEIETVSDQSADDESSYRFPHFDWADHPDQFADIAKPVDYEIQIALDDKFKRIIDEDKVGLSRYVHDKPFDPGTYYWRTRSITADGEQSEWSVTKSVSISSADELVTVAKPAAGVDATKIVQQAVREVKKFAASGKSVKLLFPAGDYFFNEQLTGALIKLNNVGNIEIEGAGAKLHFSSRFQGLIQAEHCSNVSISGFSVTYAKGSLRIQGRILEVDEEKRIAKISIEEGYSGFEASSNDLRDVFILLDPKIDGRMLDYGSSFYRLKTHNKNSDGTWTVNLDKGGDVTDWKPGGRFVFHFRSGSTLFIDFPECNAVTAYGIETDGWGGMGFVSKKGSLFNILHCKTVMQEGKWMMGNADGIHVREHVIGPWVEGTKIEAIGDDGVAYYARPISVSKSKVDGNPKAAICNVTFFNFVPGDELAFFEPREGKIILETVVETVTPQDDGKFLVNFRDELPEGMITDVGLSRVKDGKGSGAGFDGMATKGKLQDRTQIWNRSKSCGEFVIRNSEFLNIRRYGTVFRSKRGVIENTLYKCASSSAIHFRNETAWPNGLYISEIIIRNNEIVDCGFDGTGKQAVISFHFERRGGGIVQSIGPRNILIEGNKIKDCSIPAISIEATSNLLMRNNQRILADGSTVAAKYRAVRSKGVVQE